MKKTEILLLCPYSKDRKGRAGGIGSWAKVFVATFPDEEFELHPVNLAPDIFFGNMSKWKRKTQGIKTIYRLSKDIKETLKLHPNIKIMHTTTSGSLGSLRDYIAAKICRRHGIKCIMHCRFGTIKEFCESGGFFSKIFKRNLQMYDQVWVLDRLSEDYLKTLSGLKDKVFLTPNSIDVPTDIQISHRTYKKVGFVGNLLSTKGVVELTNSVASLENGTELYIAGTGPEEVKEKISSAAGNKLGKQIKMLGVLPNEKAVELMESLDIIALPTYYSGEAFPISILEAMSRGKLVVSCPRAAIPDMLTAIDGSSCGLLVPEKDVKALADAIIWCQEHRDEADEMCRKAYEKVSAAYRKEVVYDIYRKNYRMLLSERL